MKKVNILGAIAMIVMAISLLLQANNLVNDTAFSALVGVSLGLGILNLTIPCIDKIKRSK